MLDMVLSIIMPVLKWRSLRRIIPIVENTDILRRIALEIDHAYPKGHGPGPAAKRELAINSLARRLKFKGITVYKYDNKFRDFIIHELNDIHVAASMDKSIKFDEQDLSCNIETWR